MPRANINLKQSICTENPTGTDIYAFGDAAAQHVENTGIEREGGLTTLYEQETTFATAGLQSLITKSGDLLQVDASHNVRINDIAIGNVGTYALTHRGKLAGYSDAAFSATGTIIAIVKVGSTIRVDELNATTLAVLNTRANTFTMPSTTITTVALIKYMGMAYSDNLQFILSNNLLTVYLDENGLTTNYVGGLTLTTQTLSANDWRSVAWSPTLAIFSAVGAGATNYAATSPDGVTWTNRTLSANTWQSIAWSPQLALFVAVGAGGTKYAASSPDGITWTDRTLAANNWKSVIWVPQLSLFVAVGQGATNYAATSPDGITWTTRTLEANGWLAVAWSPSLSLLVAVGSGGTHYAASSPDGITWTPQTLAAGAWNAVVWSTQLGLFAAVSNSTNFAATSTNGTTWTTRTLTNDGWRGLTWSPGLSVFLAVGTGGTNRAASSPDGITWTTVSLSAANWNSVTWSPDLSKFVGVAQTTVYVFTGTATMAGSTIGWKFAASKYLIGQQGKASGFAIGDIASTMTTITDATYAVIDQFVGTAFSRAILTFNVKKNASNLLTGIGEVGYNQSGTYSATPTYYGVALAAVTVTITNNVCGPGYAEATFTRSDSGTNIYYYQAPIMGHNPGQWYDYAQSQTQTLCNGHGRLTDFNANTLGNTCALRVPMLNGTPSLISAAVIGQESSSPLDCLGVPVTLVGEFDPLFCPHVLDNGSSKVQVVYRYAGTLFYFIIESGATNTLQAVGDNAYMVNCLSPINAIDVANRTLNLGANDYNGRILFRSAAAIIATTTAVGIMQGPFANSIDTGDKLITQTFSTSTDIIPGIELPSFIDRAVPQFGVNIYLADTYSVTYQSSNITYTNGEFANVLYVNDTRDPFAIGYTFGTRVMQTELETVFTGVGVLGQTDVDYDYLGYEIGNVATGQLTSFLLFGQRYVYDNVDIWLTSFAGSIYQGKERITNAPGMQFIASSPTIAFFLSAFDNSLFAFDGGRQLTKIHRLNDIRNSSSVIEAIQNGVYNVRDGSLLLQTAGSFVWIRDGVVSQTYKKANQTSTTLYDTASGAEIANNTTKWIYSYLALSGSTVFPFTFQSAYFGVPNDTTSRSMDFIFTLWSPSKAAANLTLNCFSYDEGTYKTETRYLTVQPSDWNTLGIYRCRIQPKDRLAIAASVGIAFSSKIDVQNISVEYEADAPVVVRGSRSK